MKAIVKIVTAEPEFSSDQKLIIKRIVNVLIEHDLSVCLQIKTKVTTKTKHLKLKAS
jgi:hypothetical protein